MGLYTEDPTYKLLRRRIADLIKEKRKDKRLSKTAFALELDLARGRYTGIENASTRLYLDEVFMLADVFGIEPSKLWSRLTEQEIAPERMHKVDVPADAGERVHIVVNVVESQDRAEEE